MFQVLTKKKILKLAYYDPQLVEESRNSQTTWKKA
jgi:hypothetical protein